MLSFTRVHTERWHRELEKSYRELHRLPKVNIQFSPTSIVPLAPWHHLPSEVKPEKVQVLALGAALAHRAELTLLTVSTWVLPKMVAGWYRLHRCRGWTAIASLWEVWVSLLNSLPFLPFQPSLEIPLFLGILSRPVALLSGSIWCQMYSLLIRNSFTVSRR